MAGRKRHASRAVQLWEFLLQLLDDDECESLIIWTNRDAWEFKLRNQEEVAKRWGAQKKRPGMTYEKLSRALRYYYQKGIIRKVSGQRLVYRFGHLPSKYIPKSSVQGKPSTEKIKCERTDEDTAKRKLTMGTTRSSTRVASVRVKPEPIPSVCKKRIVDSSSKRTALSPAEQMIADVAKSLPLASVIPL